MNRSETITRDEIKTLIRSESWHEIGLIFDFEPQFMLVSGRRYFNWTCCNAQFWKAYEPHKWPRPLTIERKDEVSFPLIVSGLSVPDQPRDLSSFLIRPRSKRRRKRYRGLRPRQSRTVKNQLYARQSGICHYCHNHIPFNLWSIDHKTPLSRGGDNLPDNLIGACRECNHRKGNRTEIEYLDSLKPIGLHLAWNAK
jgi:hypothetical protein